MTTQFDEKASEVAGGPPTPLPPVLPQGPPASYNYQYYYPYPPNPAPARRGLNGGQVVFWVFYALVGVWVDLSVTLTCVLLAVLLPFTLPFMLFIGGNQGLNTVEGIILRPGDAFYGLSDSGLLQVSAGCSVIGVLMLVAVILLAKPWFKLHQAMFEKLGGASF